MRPLLADRLPDRIVMDWDDLIEPASELAGTDVRSNPATWPAYRMLMRRVIETVGAPVLLLGVCNPTELRGWPIDRWLLLDCADDERRARLDARPSDINDALTDAASYRQLGLETIDSTGISPEAVADLIAVTIEAGPTR